ncbi:hypothetical protein [Metapseudomonas otitidis]|uniref:hypothetical protein n=1 Tax=Metapseudomonas otitidis TaxID=319939 RepID=UPI001F47CBFA|nr:hypothetical protein [Pseudomonas otitidis]MDG9783717.1 hypothetical protein [Pseudomonas otitidis]
MKVLQTLGRHGGAQEGIFQYRRNSEGVFIDTSVGQANIQPAQLQITNEEWRLIVHALETADGTTFRITGAPPFDTPPNTSLHDLIRKVLPKPSGGSWHPSHFSYIAAILEHEGTLDLYHGTLGQGNSPAMIALKVHLD